MAAFASAGVLHGAGRVTVEECPYPDYILIRTKTEASDAGNAGQGTNGA